MASVQGIVLCNFDFEDVRKMNGKLIFTPEIFEFVENALGKRHIFNGREAMQLAELCQKHFDEWLEKQPSVICRDRDPRCGCQWTEDTGSFINGWMNGEHVWRGKIIVIEEIKPKACEHEVIFNAYDGKIKCSKCGVKLKPKEGWEAES